MLRDFKQDSDENKRQLYVAITRSKTNLTIHYNGRHLREIKTEDLSYISDTKLYEEPEIIAMQLTHRDVQLGYFEYVQQRMQTL